MTKYLRKWNKTLNDCRVCKDCAVECNHESIFQQIRCLLTVIFLGQAIKHFPPEACLRILRAKFSRRKLRGRQPFTASDCCTCISCSASDFPPFQCCSSCDFCFSLLWIFWNHLLTFHLSVCLLGFQECSLFLFDKKIVEKFTKPRRKEMVSEVLRKDYHYLTRFHHPKLLQVWNTFEESAWVDCPCQHCLCWNALSFLARKLWCPVYLLQITKHPYGRQGIPWINTSAFPPALTQTGVEPKLAMRQARDGRGNADVILHRHFTRIWPVSLCFKNYSLLQRSFLFSLSFFFNGNWSQL